MIVTAIEDMVGSETKAVAQAAKILRLKGRVLPVSNQLVKLVAQYSSNKTITSEHKIETHKLADNETITKLYTNPQASINSEAAEAIKQADLIILAPGDLYNSIIANLVIEGAKSAIQASKAKLIYIVNLMTLNSQTHRFTAADHLSEIEKYSGRQADHIILNKQPIPQDIIQIYQQQEEHPVKDDLGSDNRVIRLNLLADSTYQKPKSDTLKRSLLRHDPKKLAKAVIKLVS